MVASLGLRYIAVFTFCIFTLPCLSFTALAQSTPPAGVTIPPQTPDTVDQTTPKPTQSPTPPSIKPSPPRILTPPQNPPDTTFPLGESFLVKKNRSSGKYCFN